MDFERRRHSSKFVELTFSLSEILMKASCFVVLEMIADHRFHPKLYTQNVKLKLRLVSVVWCVRFGVATTTTTLVPTRGFGCEWYEC